MRFYRTNVILRRYAVETSHVLIIQGETGCGKSTQIPQYLMEAGWADGNRCVVCTQVWLAFCFDCSHVELPRLL